MGIGANSGARYEAEVVPGLAHRTADKIATVFNAIEKALPRAAAGKLADLTPEALSRFQAGLRDGKRSENTIASYLAHLRAPPWRGPMTKAAHAA